MRCVRPPGGEAWAVDGMEGVITGLVGIPSVKRGGDGIPAGKGWEGYVWTGVASYWSVSIPGWGHGPMPDERLEPLSGEAAAEAAASLANCT